MIRIAGHQYGTAAQIADRLGDDVTPTMVRNWARRSGLARHRTTDNNGRPCVLYPLDQAARIEATTRQATRGRRRRVDVEAVAAA
ncbi:hypothetical protein [Micromonospora inyonensis]|uniref:MerR HTH family regulatory protein n=1 Tax=Micromonospora inyonensis TaxID=47866 RepID=A0A1C6RX68_9ACTN|nr:hypothetical protein [Micromonospora inyonensis]SCL21663.1 hypothetical protein GA0074694_3105 [Micromonospora inyonensis]